MVSALITNGYSTLAKASGKRENGLRRNAHNVIDFHTLLEELIGETEHTKGLNGLRLHAICTASRSLLAALIEEEGRDTQAGKGEA